MQSFSSDVFTARLIQLRKEKKLTQLQMAEQLPVSRTGYSSWEQGKSKPDLEDLVKLCIFFNVSADYLLGLSDCMRVPQDTPSSLDTIHTYTPRNPLDNLTPDQIKHVTKLINSFEEDNERITMAELASKQEA